jgi:hypothetical protein
MARERLFNRAAIPGTPFRLSWPAIFGGLVAGAGVWLLLHTLGLAVGMTAFEPNKTVLRAVGIGGGVWAVLASMAALFVGGFVTARSAGTVGRSNAGLHGIVLWGAATLLGLALLGSFASNVAGTVTGAGRGAVQGIPAAARAFGIGADEVLAPVNERLARGGHPPITAPELERAIRDALATSVREGRLDRDVFETSLAENTALSRTDVREVFRDVESQMSNAGQGLGERVDDVADVGARVFWGAFALLALSLVSSFLGAIAGVTPRQRELSLRAAELPPASRSPFTPAPYAAPYTETQPQSQT